MGLALLIAVVRAVAVARAVAAGLALLAAIAVAAALLAFAAGTAVAAALALMVLTVVILADELAVFIARMAGLIVLGRRLGTVLRVACGHDQLLTVKGPVSGSVDHSALQQTGRCRCVGGLWCADVVA